MTHSRRVFLHNAVVVGGGALFLGACSSTAKPGGSSAAGRVEGAQLITDPAAMPTTFKESPEFAALVAQGKLPPVAQRIGRSPLVLKPVQGVGRYGGQLRRGVLGNSDTLNAARFCAGPDSLLYWDYQGKNIVPNIAKGFEFSDGNRVLTLHLREGMKWSDGMPFTADDIVFWRQDVNLNPSLGGGTQFLRINGAEVQVRKVDDLTVQYVSPVPNTLMPQYLAGWTDLAGMATAVSFSVLGAAGGVLPKHYLSKFLPQYSSEAAVNKTATDAGFDGWVAYFTDRATVHLNPELPVVSPWMVTRALNQPPFELAANPYSIWVDNEGNQLPYIPQITMSGAENLEVLGLRAAGGNYDFQDRGLGVTNMPVLVTNQQRSNYTVHRAPSSAMECGVRFNLAYDQDAELGDLIRNVDFRRALSLGIDRQQINQSFFLGSSKPSAVMPADDSPYFPGAQWRTKWATLDVPQANSLLDKIGLTAKDDQGYRLRRDGKGRIRLDVTTNVSFIDFPSAAEMVKRQWIPLGIDVNVQSVNGNLLTQRASANQLMLSVHSIGTGDPFLDPGIFLPTTPGFPGMIGIPYVQWFNSGGRQGTAPPPELQPLTDAMNLYYKGLQAGDDDRAAIGKQLYQMHADQVWSAGIVGFGLSVYGVYLANNKLRNVPASIVSSENLHSPVNTYPMTFYYE
jgi:peptide/nickel transport system substrate-binding protein